MSSWLLKHIAHTVLDFPFKSCLCCLALNWSDLKTSQHGRLWSYSTAAGTSCCSYTAFIASLKEHLPSQLEALGIHTSIQWLWPSHFAPASLQRFAVLSESLTQTMATLMHSTEIRNSQLTVPVLSFNHACIYKEIYLLIHNISFTHTSCYLCSYLRNKAKQDVWHICYSLTRERLGTVIIFNSQKWGKWGVLQGSFHASNNL